MLLAADIGNTNISLGVFQAHELIATWRLRTDAHRLPDEFGALLTTLLAHRQISLSHIESIAVSSVVPPLVTTFEELGRQYFNTQPLIIGPGIRTGVRIVTDNPREVGADRICNAAAAHRLYGGSLIIIDFGTATTFDVVSSSGDYLGGAIAPGLEIAMEALFAQAAKLPSIELQFPRTAIGKNTVHAMQSGVLFGYLGLVEGIIKRLKDEIVGDPRVIATGGLSSIIGRQSNVIDILDRDITLQGLRIIHDLNQPR